MQEQVRPDHGETIEPVTFHPTDAAIAATGRRLRPIHWIVGSLVILLAAIVFFIFTAKAVRLSFSPPAEQIALEGGFSFSLGGVYLLRRGDYQLHAETPGHYPLDAILSVGAEQNQEFQFEFRPLPGIVHIDSKPIAGARVEIDGTDSGVTPVTLDVEAGQHVVHLEAARYLPYEIEYEVEGKRLEQSLNAQLLPAWAPVSFATKPVGATVMIDGEPSGETPATMDLLQGTHQVTLKLPGFKAWSREIVVAANEPMRVPQIALVAANGLVLVRTSPSGAGITVNGEYRGQSPLELELKPGRAHSVQIFKSGYEGESRSVTASAEAEQTLSVKLTPLLGQVKFAATPADAELYVDGILMGRADHTLSLPSTPHKIEIRKSGYAPHSTSVIPRPGFIQEVKVRLLTEAEARRLAIPPVIKTAAGQELVLLHPTAFTMGASRREPGRRANEVLRDVTLTRAFYLSRNEVTNAEFAQFMDAHDSGEFEDEKLNGDPQPVVRVAWDEAARYCNWLSARDKLPPAYVEKDGAIIGFDPKATGYRLPTEAEWAWAARYVEGAPLLKFPWGDSMPPSERVGNFADRTAAHLIGRIIFNYTDGYIVSAPVGTFPSNQHGINDLGGNVAEWTNDFYEIPSGEPSVDPTGPERGEYHVIRGSSWMNGTVTDLRYSFRDYGIDGRQDVGFRLARFAE